MAFRNNPVLTGTPPGTPVGSVATPNEPNGDLTALEGGPRSGPDSNSNYTAPASIWVKDGNNVTQGQQSDPAWSGSGSGSLIAILKKIVAGQTGAASVVQSTGAPQGTNWRMAGDYTEVSGLSAGALNADLLPAMDVSAYKSAVLMPYGTWSGTLTIQGSNDNFVNQIYSVGSWRMDGVGSMSPTFTSNVPMYIPIMYRHLRIRMNPYTSGTANGTIELYTFPVFTFPGSINVQPSNVPNTTPWLVTGSNNNGVQAAGGGLTVIKASPGRLDSAMITATGTVGLTVYDNASAASGTALLVIPANPTVGTRFPVEGWAKNGITSGGVANCPGVTFYFA